MSETTTKPNTRSRTSGQVKPGYKKTQIGIIPEDWEVRKLITQANVDKENISSDFNGEYINYVSLSDIQNGKIFPNKIEYKSAPSRAKRVTQEGDVLLATVRPNLKNFAIIDRPNIIASTGFAVLGYKKMELRFLYNFLYSHYAEKQYFALTVGSNYPALNSNDVKNLKLPIPPLPEQEAIADCLTTWDKGIEKLSALIAAKKEQKKGLMQQLFNGQLTIDNKQWNNEQLSMNNVQLKRVENEEDRLKGWKKVRLGDLGKTFNGLTGKTKDDFGVGLPFVSYLNVFRNNKIEENTSFDYVNIESSENQNTLNYGDLIFTTSSETPNEVGISSVVLFKPKEKLYLNSFCFGMRLNDFSILKPEYAVYLLRGQNFRREMYKLAQGSTRYNLSKASFVKIQITVPSLEEQTAIAEVLTAADKEIELLEQKLEAFKLQKKGLMQVLLTGEKRLIDNE